MGWSGAENGPADYLAKCSDYNKSGIRPGYIYMLFFNSPWQIQMQQYRLLVGIINSRCLPEVMVLLALVDAPKKVPAECFGR